MMPRVFCVLVFLGLVPIAAVADEAEVVLVTTQCQDYFVVDTGGSRYALLEWYAGDRLDKGDKLTGDFAHFGVQDMQIMPGGRRARVWVEDYDLSQDDINDKLSDKCS
jgi:hypothetical protein